MSHSSEFCGDHVNLFRGFLARMSHPNELPSMGRTRRSHEGGADRHDRTGSRVLERTRHPIFSSRRRRTASQETQGEAQNGSSSARESRPRGAGSFQKNFAETIRRSRECHGEKPLKVVAFDEARFGLINWHRRRYCPRSFRPPYIVRRSYRWTYLYAAVEPTTGESFCLYLPVGWIADVWRYFSTNSLKPTLSIICSLCLMVHQAIAQKRSSAPGM